MNNKLNRIRILFNDQELPYLMKDSNIPVGGACVRTHIFCKGLISSGQKVGVLTWKGAKNYVNRKTDVELVETYDLNKGFRKLRWIYYRIPCIYNKIYLYKPDLIICKSTGVLLLIFGIISKLLKIKLVYMVTNDIFIDNRINMRLNKFDSLANRIGLYLVDSVFCQNDYQFSIVSKKLPKKYIFKITNPYLGHGLNMRVSPSRRYIAWVGIFQKQKNMSALLRIVKRNKKYQFCIAGSETSILDANTKNILKKLRSCDNVKFVGYLKRKKVLEFLSKAIVLLNTSDYEGFSNTFLEAFSVGTPIVSLNVNPDNIITKNNLGCIVEEESVGEKIDFFRNHYEKDKMEKKIRTYLRDQHGYKDLSLRLIEKLKNILYKSKHGSIE